MGYCSTVHPPFSQTLSTIVHKHKMQGNLLGREHSTEVSELGDTLLVGRQRRYRHSSLYCRELNRIGESRGDRRSKVTLWSGSRAQPQILCFRLWVTYSERAVPCNVCRRANTWASRAGYALIPECAEKPQESYYSSSPEKQTELLCFNRCVTL